ncbi:hypothetical protein DASC09_009600 [Saccharomycopsis crataegensis]|uniref:Protein kinase domain-containing protein n=1 Tax=Saccharomycopsis crataegensis TaxID=43959 RepID=A0AAV5QGW3_9ASCO|nr:hypothetical protein DASC09_009600 [Saccharomycopsis crataegensis]
MDFFDTNNELLDELKRKFHSMKTNDQLCDEFWRSVAAIVDIQDGKASPSSWDSPLELKNFSCLENVFETFNGSIIHKTNFTIDDIDYQKAQNMIETNKMLLLHYLMNEAERQREKMQSSQLINESFGNLEGAGSLRPEIIKRILNALQTKALLLLNPPVLLLQEESVLPGKEKITESSSGPIKGSKGSKFYTSSYRKNNLYKSLRYCFIERRNDLTIETWIGELAGVIAQASAKNIQTPSDLLQLDNHSNEADFSSSLFETTLKPTFLMISKMMEIKGLEKVGLRHQTRINFSVREKDKVKYFTNIVDFTVRSQQGIYFPIELKLPSLAQHLQRIKESYFGTKKKTSKEFFVNMKCLSNLCSQAVYQAIGGHSIGGVLTDTQSFLLFCFDLSELQKNQELQGKLRKYEKSKDKWEIERLVREIETFMDNHLEKIITNHPFKTADTINITQIDMKTLCLTNDSMVENDFSITLKLLVFIYKVMAMNIEHQTLIRFFYDRLLQKLLLSTREKLEIIKDSQKAISLFYKFIFKEDQRAGKLFQTVCPSVRFLENRKRDFDKAHEIVTRDSIAKFERNIELKDLKMEEILSGENVGERLSTVLKVSNRDGSHSVIKLLDVHRIYDGSEVSDSELTMEDKIKLSIDLFSKELICYLALAGTNITPTLESFGLLRNEKYESLSTSDLEHFVNNSTDSTYLSGLYIKFNFIEDNPPSNENEWLLTFLMAMKKLICMHQNKIFHGDIKRGNFKIMSYQEYEKKTCDFLFLDFGISIAKIKIKAGDGNKYSSDDIFYNKLFSRDLQKTEELVKNDISSIVAAFSDLGCPKKYPKKVISHTLKTEIENLEKCVKTVSQKIKRHGKGIKTGTTEMAEDGQPGSKRQKRDSYDEEFLELTQEERKFTQLEKFFDSILKLINRSRKDVIFSFDDLVDIVIRARLGLPKTDIRFHYCEFIKKTLNSS